MSGPEVLIEGVVFGESPRWHDGRLWFSDCGAHQVIGQTWTNLPPPSPTGQVTAYPAPSAGHPLPAIPRSPSTLRGRQTSSPTRSCRTA